MASRLRSDAPRQHHLRPSAPRIPCDGRLGRPLGLRRWPHGFVAMPQEGNASPPRLWPTLPLPQLNELDCLWPCATRASRCRGEGHTVGLDLPDTLRARHAFARARECRIANGVPSLAIGVQCARRSKRNVTDRKLLGASVQLCKHGRQNLRRTHFANLQSTPVLEDGIWTKGRRRRVKARDEACRHGFGCAFGSVIDL